MEGASQGIAPSCVVLAQNIEPSTTYRLALAVCRESRRNAMSMLLGFRERVSLRVCTLNGHWAIVGLLSLLWPTCVVCWSWLKWLKLRAAVERDTHKPFGGVLLSLQLSGHLGWIACSPVLCASQLLSASLCCTPPTPSRVC